MKCRRTVLVLLVVSLAGCGGVPDPTENVSEQTPEPVPGERISDNLGENGGTYRYVDNETGAVCYVVQNGGGDPAIDCVLPEEVPEQ